MVIDREEYITIREISISHDGKVQICGKRFGKDRLSYVGETIFLDKRQPNREVFCNKNLVLDSSSTLDSFIEGVDFILSPYKDRRGRIIFFISINIDIKDFRVKKQPMRDIVFVPCQKHNTLH